MPNNRVDLKEKWPAAHWPFFRSIGLIPAVSILILGAMLSWVAYSEYQQIQEAEYRLLEAHARNASAQVSSALNKIERLLHQVGIAQQATRPAQGQALMVVMNQYRGDLPELGQLVTTDAMGRIRTASDSSMIGSEVADEPLFKVHLERERPPALFIGRPQKMHSGDMAVAFSLPMFDPDENFSGVLSLSIDFKFLLKVMQSINPDDSASMSVIFNQYGDLLYRRSEPEKFFGNNISKISRVFSAHIEAGKPVTRYRGPSAQNGKTRLFLIHNIGNSGLALILSRQLDEVLINWRNTAMGYVLFFSFASMLIIYLATVANRRKQQILISKDFSEQLIATANVMVLGLTPNGHITIFNETAERICGYSREEALGRSWFELAVSPQAPSFVKEMFNVFRHGGAMPHLTEYSILTKEGHERTIVWQNSETQMPRMTILFGIDITERKLIEEALVKARQEAENANLSKSKFLAAASHDLRQPIYAQGLFLEVLSRTELSDKQRELLASTCAASEATADMLNTLLDFSRIEAGVIEPRRQTFRIQPLLNKLEREFAQQADTQGLLYRSRETTLAGYSDPALVELILRNLVSNAIRYTNHGGVLVVCRKRAGQLVLEVWDTGIGISTSEQNEVFREFHQLGNPERDRRKGLGLGLAIAAGLAHQLGSRLSLVSTPQRGSVFRFALPMAAGSAVRNEPPQDSAALLHRLDARVLIIDDDELVRLGMRHLLQMWGCECLVAESIEEALLLVQQHTPDLVISDYRLREQRTGIEAITALRALFGPSLPALLVSGDTAPERLRQARASGIPLLIKPIAPEQLYRHIVMLLHAQAGTRLSSGC